MELFPIGAAAAKLGLRTSALRYYDELGLVPAVRRGGRRFYGPAELRRLAFVQMLGRVGIGLSVAAAVLDSPDESWREHVREQRAVLDRQIAEATLARDVLDHLAACPSGRPTTECQTMSGLLDRRLEGASLAQLAEEEGHALPPASSRRPPP